MERQLKFSCLSDSSNGVLSPDDLFFFYYGIGLDTLMGTPAIYQESNEIINFIRNRNLTIDAIEQDKLPSSFEEGKIYFVKYSTEDKYNSFYRHLRNAFAHYHINHSSNYYIMNDYSDDAGTKKTMIGKILCQDLKDLTDLFYKQREISDANY